MEIIGFFESDRQDHWLAEIERSGWEAAKLLYKLISEGSFFDTLGEGSEVLLLTEGDELISFCTYAKLDDIQPTDLTPWIGFVYTFPERRGHRYVGLLIGRAEELAEQAGHPAVYISTDHTGLYEKYGYEYYKQPTTISGDPSRLLEKAIPHKERAIQSKTSRHIRPVKMR